MTRKALLTSAEPEHALFSIFNYSPNDNVGVSQYADRPAHRSVLSSFPRMGSSRVVTAVIFVVVCRSNEGSLQSVPMLI